MEFASPYVYLKKKPTSQPVSQQGQQPQPQPQPPSSGAPAPVVPQVLVQPPSEEDVELFAEEELNQGVKATLTSPLLAPPQTPASSTSTFARRFRRMDTNVLRVDLGTLSQEAYIATGDPIFCKKCKAAFNSLSKLKPWETTNADSAGSSSAEEGKTKGKEKKKESEEGEEVREGSQLWICEFCNEKNPVFIEREELPTSDTMDFIIRPATMLTNEKDTSNTLFCIDTSGSMCVTTEVKGKAQLRGAADKLSELSRTLNPEGGQQYMPKWDRNVTYISRLQCVQAAVDAQLTSLERTQPNSCVGLVSFNDDVTITGDGHQTPVVLAGDKLKSFEESLRTGTSFILEKPISQSKTQIAQKLFALEDKGATALGPALLASVGVAAQKPGSKVILCTDGLANIGLGSMDTDDGANEEEAEAFYRRVAAYAKDNGVIINVISIKGTTCSMENLGILADTTGGQVDIVDPLELTKNFHSILATPVIALRVRARLMLHKGLFFRDEEDITAENVVERDIGNVTGDSTVTFEYGVKEDAVDLLFGEERPQKLETTESGCSGATSEQAGEESGKSESASSQGSSGDGGDVIAQLPFQVQIHFTRLDGTEMIRIITKSKPVTDNRELAEKDVDVKVMGLNTIQKTAKYARSGQYDKARLYTYSSTRLMNRTARSAEQQSAYSSYIDVSERLDTVLRTAQEEEKASGRTYVESEGEDALTTHTRSEARRKSRARNDSASYTLYKMKTTTYSSMYTPFETAPPPLFQPSPSPVPDSGTSSSPSSAEQAEPAKEEEELTAQPSPTPMELEKKEEENVE